MKNSFTPRVFIAVLGAFGCWASSGAAEPLPDRPDPREIPLPKIQTTLGDLPGPDQLPVRKEMPDVLTMNDGTKVTTPAQFKERQKEMRKILEYYHVGRMPPAPGNVKGTVTLSEDVEVNGKKYKYRTVHLTFGPEEKLTMDIGIVAPVEGGPFPTVMQFGGAVPGAPQRTRLGAGPLEGRGADILLPPEIALAGAQNAARGGAPTGAQVANGEAPKSAPAPAAAGPGAAAPARGRGGPAGGGATAAAFASRYAQVLEHGYAVVGINTNDCAEDTTLRLPDGSFAFRSTRFFPAYPGYDWGIIGGWAWGAMRVVDYLQNDPAVDKTKLIITGVSRNGKAAMITGAFDDRIALVAPGASSGLGT
ncbi:MAG: alpha/beta hydrolase family protein, partial [Opitutaceae bacterium]